MLDILHNIKDYASLIFAFVMFVYALVMFIIGRIKKHNLKLTLEDENDELKGEIEDKNAAFMLVDKIIPLAIKKAEEMPNIDGETKKLLAMSEILLNCNENCIDFEMFKDFISEQIEAMITFSKTINKRTEGENANG